MKKLYLILTFILISTTNVFAETSSNFSIKFTGTETSLDKSKSETSKQVTQPTLINGWQKVNNTNYWVYFVNNQMTKGWIFYNNSWYYLGEDYIMVANKWIEYNKKWYYLGSDGKMLVNTTTPDGYKVNASGEWEDSSSSSSSSSDISTTSKYLYKRVSFGDGASSITTSTELGDETLKKNIIKMTKGSNFTLPNTKTYNSLTFDYIIKSPNSNNEYLLEIYENGELIEEIEDFSSSKKELTIDFEKNSKLDFKWYVDTEDGSKTAKATTLYIYNGILKKNTDTDDDDEDDD